jgi:cAMP-dependent protein kinase regulator
MNKSFLFSHLEDKEKNIIALAMAIKNYKKGDMVIKQGDDGNELFVVSTGSLKCFKVFPGD